MVYNIEYYSMKERCLMTIIQTNYLMAEKQSLIIDVVQLFELNSYFPAPSTLLFKPGCQ